jgi:hypothetical protein
VTELIQITTDDMPPLRQSTAEVMNCRLSYVETFIKGRKQPGGLDSARGTQIHNALGRYASWCASKQLGQDLEAFDRLSRGVGLAAHKILAGVRESYEVDWRHLFATELMMSLDENFQPTDVVESLEGVVGDSGEEPAYQGTLDTLYVFREEHRINIDDFKSHVRPYDPGDTLQGKMYCLMTFQHFPWVQEIRFRLVFVRYHRLYREIIYKRSDVPQLIDAIRSSRNRQKMIHEDYDNNQEIEATAGTHCFWCALLSDASCPIGQYNSAMQLTMQQRMNFALWYSQFSRVNNAVMKDYVQATGRAIVTKDGNNKFYKFGPEEKESKLYPVFRKTVDGLEKDNQGNFTMPIIDLLLDHAYSDPEDIEWLGNLSISGTKLEGALKAKKRAITHQAISDAADKVTKVSMRISKPLDQEPADNDDDDEPEDEEEF